VASSSHGHGRFRRRLDDKIVAWPRLLDMRARWRRDGRTVVWTNGCFDLLHTGHIRCLAAARDMGDVLVVGVNSDVSIRQLKGANRPIIPARERMEILAALESVDYVVEFDDLTPVKVLGELQPDIHCKGSDYAPPAGKPIPEAAVIAAYGGRIAFFPIEGDVSTTSLVHRICTGDGRNSP
jgi:D-glycero-beta-D-manno-heptose 1-phosphate adenylyltransferase